MNIEAYKKYWTDKGDLLLTYSLSQIDPGRVDNDTYSFLTKWGLPSQAAPFLSFDVIGEDKLLTPNQLFRIDLEGLDDYLVFGVNGSGDPVCIDTTRSNAIVYLNHDNRFERIPVNSSISKFALSLVKYHDFFASLVNSDPDDFSRRKFSDDEFSALKREFLDIDNTCFVDNSFWSTEINGLLWERDNE